MNSHWITKIIPQGINNGNACKGKASFASTHRLKGFHKANQRFFGVNLRSTGLIAATKEPFVSQ
jgi:hypothetical protein